MITLTPGTVPQPPARRWWEGLKVQCPTCGALFQLEADDVITNTVAETAQLGGKQFVHFACPTDGCDTGLDLERNRLPFGEVQQPTPPTDAWTPADGLECAWGIIANVSGGNWEAQSEEWQTAAAKWRDRYAGGPGKAPLHTPRFPEA